MQQQVVQGPGLAGKNSDTAQLDVRASIRPADAERFTALMLSELPAYYDGVDDTFPRSILNSAEDGRDPFGYFTKRKIVYAGYVDETCVCFTVATIKRGGSAKIGPTAVLPGYRRSGFASQLRDVVESELFERHAIRKLYMTIASANTPALMFNLNRGYTVEGVLCGQYQPGRDELVLGLFNPAHSGSEAPARSKRNQPQPAPANAANRWDIPSARDLESFLGPCLDDCFDGLDLDFYQSIIDACQESRQQYHLKGKRLLVERCDGAVAAVAVYVPKRGGSVKLSPCVAGRDREARRLISAGLETAAAEGRRKLYVHVPETMTTLVEVLLSMGFALEAQLREAYKPGIDTFALGRLL